jgi:hypothetical protein
MLGVGEVAAGGQGVGVVFAADPLPVGEGLLVRGMARPWSAAW